MKKIIKLVYQTIPFKHQLLKVIRFLVIPPKRIRDFLRFDGIVNVELNTGQSFNLLNKNYAIENEFFWLGKSNPWERESLKIWQKLCLNKSTIFDIGANTGVYSGGSRNVYLGSNTALGTGNVTNSSSGNV